MPTTNCLGSISLTVCAGILLLSPRLCAQFPAAGQDVTTSLGQFKIAIVDPAINGFLTANYPKLFTLDPAAGGYDSTTHRLLSPVLFDPSTTIFHDNPTGVPRTVQTQILSLNLTDTGSGAFVRAGNNAPGAPASLGMVQSQSSSGDPVHDFPATSFFDVFVDVGLPGVGTLHNPSTDPLLVTNQTISSFPPQVVYYHGNSSAVPLVTDADGPKDSNNKPLWHAGDTFGYLVLAGHGVGYGTADAAGFAQTVATFPEAPEPVTWVIASAFAVPGMGLHLWRKSRRAQQSCK